MPKRTLAQRSASAKKGAKTKALMKKARDMRNSHDMHKKKLGR